MKHLSLLLPVLLPAPIEAINLLRKTTNTCLGWLDPTVTDNPLAGECDAQTLKADRKAGGDKADRLTSYDRAPARCCEKLSCETWVNTGYSGAQITCTSGSPGGYDASLTRRRYFGRAQSCCGKTCAEWDAMGDTLPCSGNDELLPDRQLGGSLVSEQVPKVDASETHWITRFAATNACCAPQTCSDWGADRLQCTLDDSASAPTGTMQFPEARTDCCIIEPQEDGSG